MYVIEREIFGYTVLELPKGTKLGRLKLPFEYPVSEGSQMLNIQDGNTGTKGEKGIKFTKEY